VGPFERLGEYCTNLSIIDHGIWAVRRRGVFADWVNVELKAKENAHTIANLDTAPSESV